MVTSVPDTGFDVVTGAFSYTGNAIARRLLQDGRRVRTLTAHPDRPSPIAGRVEVAPYAFDDLDALTGSLEGASTIYNTYWVRFDRGDVSFDRAIENSKTLFRAAREAGVARAVHLSVTKPSFDFALPLLPRQGTRRAGARRERPVPCGGPPEHRLRSRRHLDEQHRLAAAALAGLRDPG